jgi:hypothetical protein
MTKTMRKLRLRSAHEKLKMQKRAKVQEALLQREINNIEGEDPLWDLQVRKNSTKQSIPQ